jgi:hypothetical protein
MEYILIGHFSLRMMNGTGLTGFFLGGLTG